MSAGTPALWRAVAPPTRNECVDIRVGSALHAVAALRKTSDMTSEDSMLFGPVEHRGLSLDRCSIRALRRRSRAANTGHTGALPLFKSVRVVECPA